MSSFLFIFHNTYLHRYKQWVFSRNVESYCGSKLYQPNGCHVFSAWVLYFFFTKVTPRQRVGRGLRAPWVFWLSTFEGIEFSKIILYKTYLVQKKHSSHILNNLRKRRNSGRRLMLCEYLLNQCLYTWKEKFELGNLVSFHIKEN